MGRSTLKDNENREIRTTRRVFLKASAASGAVLAAGPLLLKGCDAPLDDDTYETVQAAAGETPHDKKLFNKYFKVAVQGMYDEVPGVVTMDPGRVTVSIEEATQGDMPDYRTYTYGSHEYDDLTLTVQTGPGMVKLQKWADKAMKVGGQGDALRRDISLYLLARDKSTVLKTINCFGAFPVDFRAHRQTGGGDIKAVTLVCNIDRIEVA